MRKRQMSPDVECADIAAKYLVSVLLQNAANTKPELVESEMRAKTFAYAERKLEFIKNPVVAEFLGLSGDATFTETMIWKQHYL